MFRKILITILLNYIETSHHARYECGEHGRFEYCIDDIPGCIIGCYCHPGYYFDTESKICEPNSKLTVDLRRSHEKSSTTSAPLQVNRRNDNPLRTTTASKQETLDNKVDAITNNVDELSDWLYNQFLSLNVTESEKNPSRRSGYLVKKRRYNHSRKKHSRKSKRKGSKNKMLRITEDDSLFDSGSSDSGSDSMSSSDDSDSGESWEDKDKSDHGHRKIVMIHKKPKPPLPSFVFLPDSQGGTPFFPPVSLSRPGVPMYPMVPVPPMLQPSLYPPPVLIISSNNGNDTSSTSSPTGSESTTVSTNVSSTESATSTATEPTTEKKEEVIEEETKPDAAKEDPGREGLDDIPDALNIQEEFRDLIPSGGRIAKKPKHRKHKGTNGNFAGLKNPSLKRIGKRPFVTPLTPSALKSSDIFSSKNIKSSMKFNNLPFSKEMQSLLQEREVPPIEDGSPLLDNMLFRKFFVNPLMQKQREQDNDIVKFKHLADLIHKLNKEPNVNERTDDKKYNFKFPFMASNISTLSNTDENFYSKLGKQIASLVHKIDTNGNGNQEVNIEIQPISREIYNTETPISNLNNFASRNFWERYVRSTTNPNTINQVKNNAASFPSSNEELSELENIVEKTATIAPKLSLLELESIIKTMDGSLAKDGQTKFAANIQSQDNRLKINILPKYALYSPKKNPNKRTLKIPEKEIEDKRYDILKHLSTNAYKQNTRIITDKITSQDQFNQNFINNTVMNPILNSRYGNRNTHYLDRTYNRPPHNTGSIQYKPNTVALTNAYSGSKYLNQDYFDYTKYFPQNLPSNIPQVNNQYVYSFNKPLYFDHDLTDFSLI